MISSARTRVIAFYLPQFHPIPENDQWWSEGFTEWTNVKKAKPLWLGHSQPRVPTELGYYNLLDPAIRQAQATLAKEHGIEGFCYWHYWFGNGDMLLEKPFNEVLASGKPDFPFCLGWANHSWIGKGFGAGGRLLKKQAYPGINDHKQHFDWWLQAFRDPRYITVDGKPLLFIYRPKDIPNIKSVTVYWRSLAQEAGLPGLHLVGETLTEHNYKQYGFDAHSSFNLFAIEKNPSKFWGKLFQYRRWLGLPNIHRYSQAEQYWVSPSQHQYPYLIPNWDTTPRYGRYAEILLGSSPEKFRKHVRSVIQAVKDRPPQQRIVFLKSWNEWAEGNYIEPDAKWGRAYLEVLRDELFKNH